jgi:hypothetical protein
MEVRKSTHVDEVLERADGKPTRVRRSFEDLEASSEATFGDNMREFEMDTPLAGSVIEVAVDEEGDASAQVVEGDSSVDSEALEGHRPELALDALLPAGEVEVGSSWDLDAKAVLRGLGLDLGKALYKAPEPEGGGEGESRGGRRGGFGGGGSRTFDLLEGAEWTGEARVSATDGEAEGLTCWVVELELKAEGELPEQSFGGGRGRAFGLAQLGPPTAFENDFQIELSGKLFVSVEKHRPVRLELEGTFRSNRVREGSRGESTFRMDSSTEGDFELVITVTEVEEE